MSFRYAGFFPGLFVRSSSLPQVAHFKGDSLPL
jgi:hypothetical protein